MIERGRRFVESLLRLAQRGERDWRVCPHCDTYAIKNGTWTRRPWTLAGRKEIKVQRYLCQECGKSYSERDPRLVARSWYSRGVHRFGVDLWMYIGTSYRRAACLLRSLAGCQERWKLWHVIRGSDESGETCYLSPSTVQRWVRRAGKRARQGVRGQWSGIENSGQFGTDGLWARLRGLGKQVLLLLVDTATGLVWTTQAADDEANADAWEGLFQRASQAGLEWRDMDGIVSDGAQGLYSFLRAALSRVHHQRCVWHFWRNMAGDMARVSTAATEGDRTRRRAQVTNALHQVIDARHYEAAEDAMRRLRDDPTTAPLAQKVFEQLDRLLYHLHPGHEGLARVSPEWLWRDFRLRLGHGRNHGSRARLAEAGALWMVYRNFTPAQWRSEKKRRYKHPGLSPLQVAGAGPGKISYLDALEV